MWSDNETDKDFLNFSYVADIAAEMISQAKGRPISMGVSGSWGVGKSSMMKLLAQSLRARTDEKFLFIEFNAWLYQGYDDTRAALMEIIARSLIAKAAADKDSGTKIHEKAVGLLARVKWFRLASFAATTVAPIALGLPPVGLIGEGIAAFKGLTDGSVTQQDLDAAEGVASKAGETAGGFLRDAPHSAPSSPPRAIHDFRDELEETLEELGVTLVVLIDDLDRCLPTTSISTLEAMRLFLFLRRTAFIIAADEKVIRAAVRVHFKDISLDDDLVTNYFDKLIQVPIRVPPLGTQDVRAYLMMLFIEESSLPEVEKERLRQSICKRLGETWIGKRVDRAFVTSEITNCPANLALRLDLADRIAPILTTSSKISGNPRLIKRFLNTLDIRMAISRAQKVGVDEAALAKMLLFERCGTEKAYAALLSAINESDDGRAQFLAPMEAAAAKDPASVKLEGDWDNAFTREWLALHPPLVGLDLRGAAFVSREHLPIITAADRLTSEGAEILEALLKVTTFSAALPTKIALLPVMDVAIITERLISRARAVSQWGTPSILHAMLTVAHTPGEHVHLIGRFLRTIPGEHLTPAIIPLLADKAWAAEILTGWHKNSQIKEPVRKAINNALKKVG